jgi:hypothetical protein
MCKGITRSWRLPVSTIRGVGKFSHCWQRGVDFKLRISSRIRIQNRKPYSNCVRDHGAKRIFFKKIEKLYLIDMSLSLALWNATKLQSLSVLFLLPKQTCIYPRWFVDKDDLAQSLYIISVSSYFFVSYCLLFRKWNTGSDKKSTGLFFTYLKYKIPCGRIHKGCRFCQWNIKPVPVLFLCTGGAYYVPYSSLLISNKFFYWGGAAWAGRSRSFMHLLLHPPQYGPWNLPHGALVHKTTYAPMFFVPQMALAYRLDAISKGQKNSRIPGPNPLPLALVMDAHIQNIMHGALYKS